MSREKASGHNGNREDPLFKPLSLGRLSLPNRFVRSATNDRTADRDGRPTERTEVLFDRLAEGGIGLIVTGHAYVHPSGIAGFDQWSIADDSLVPDYRRITDAVHRHGGLVVMQIAHAGRQSRARWIDRTPMAPSAVREPVYGVDPQPMSETEIETIIAAFGAAAGRAAAAGFDGVQVHAAHGYLVSQFLSPHTNRRDDGWGGDPDRRFRFLREVIDRIRGEAGRDFPLLVKLNSTDGLPGGLTLDDSVDVAVRLDGLGVDAVEVSGGMAEAVEFTARRDLGPEEENYFLDDAAGIRKRVACPVIAVGGFRRLAEMRSALTERGIDAVSLSRPFVRQPDLVRLFREGKDRADCVSCNGCFGARVRPTRCVKLDRTPPWAE